MDVQGLCIVGSFAGLEQVAKRATGEIVEGFFKLAIECRRPDGSTYTMRPTFSRYDRDGDRPTAISQQLDELALKVGEPVAVRVSTKASGSYVNLEAVRVFALNREEVAAG